MNITVRIQYVYGVKLVYPVSDEAKLLARIAATKTLTPSVIELIKELGYAINVEAETL